LSIPQLGTAGAGLEAALAPAYHVMCHDTHPRSICSVVRYNFFFISTIRLSAQAVDVHMIDIDEATSGDHTTHPAFYNDGGTNRALALEDD
jgi:hypothetical protein